MYRVQTSGDDTYHTHMDGELFTSLAAALAAALARAIEWVSDNIYEDAHDLEHNGNTINVRWAIDITQADPDADDLEQPIAIVVKYRDGIGKPEEVFRVTIVPQEA